MPLPTKQFWTVLFALIALRLVIGFHFLNEGVTKVRSGTFSCENFLGVAKGPLAGHFQSLLDDHDGRIRLCLNEDGRIDTEQTFAIWEDFVQTVSREAKFDDARMTESKLVLMESRNHLQYFLDQQEADILAWFSGEQRLDGFRRDGGTRRDAASQVESLNEQLYTIKTDRKKVAKPWLTEVELTWDELEARVNRIAGTEGPDERFQLARPYAQPWSKQQVIDRFLPWFDVLVGLLLIVGLFSRFAALAGAGLLLGVVATQPFWVLGTVNTYYQWIEIAALGVLFATAAGRFGGLDYFLTRRNRNSVNEA